jgi:hypothetical protein
MKRSIFILLFFVSVKMVSSQTLFPEVFSCFGGYGENSTVQLTWTVGEPLFTTVENSSNILTQGFNQTLIVEEITSDVNEIPGCTFKIFPNPTSDKLNVSIKMEEQKDLMLLLFDINGKTVFTGKYSNTVQQIDVSGFAAGVYLLKIIDGKNAIKLFKIQKIQ